MKFSTICVFCGSNMGANPVYAELAATMGEVLAQRKIRLVYGGGSIGLMGIVAQSALRNNGEVVSIIPRALVPKELVGESIGELIVVETMHERKAIMARESDAFIAMPGGYGTLDEIFEMVTWTQLGIHAKPLGLLNIRNFFSPLLQMLDQAVTEAFIQAQHRQIVVAAKTPVALLDKLDAHDVPESLIQWMQIDET